MSPDHADETFDIIVVGAGSAGCAVAARLSEDPDCHVLLLEAGGSDKRQDVTIPAAFAQQFKSEIDWNYQTVDQEPLAGRSVYWPRGKVLGGSSSMNAMMWVRGFAADYEEWGRLAGPEWGWDAIRPLLDSTEIRVSDQQDPNENTAAMLEAAGEAGFPIEEANLDAPEGFTQTRVTQVRGARWNAAKGYLAPARRRPNLTVRPEAHATRILFEGTRAVGVEHVAGGTRRTARARREIVLSAGAVNTPQLLQLSGIGDPAHLAEHGIDVVASSPEVGRNMRDHLLALMAAEVHGGTLKDAETPKQLLKYLTRRTGMLTSNVGEMYGFVRSGPGVPVPDLEIIGGPVAYVNEGLAGIPGHAVSMGPILLRPLSRGTVTLASSDPFAAPIIDPRYLSDPEGQDRARLLSGLAAAQKILDSPALASRRTGRYLAPYRGELMPPPERHEYTLEHLSHTLYHPTSTARMGTDDASVVDPQLRVRGVQGLRVADASVMPEIIRGHTHAPSVVIGEKAAQLIRRESAGRAAA